jgi:hypothetical protein
MVGLVAHLFPRQGQASSILNLWSDGRVGHLFPSYRHHVVDPFTITCFVYIAALDVLETTSEECHAALEIISAECPAASTNTTNKEHGQHHTSRVTTATNIINSMSCSVPCSVNQATNKQTASTTPAAQMCCNQMNSVLIN